MESRTSILSRFGYYLILYYTSHPYSITFFHIATRHYPLFPPHSTPTPNFRYRHSGLKGTAGAKRDSNAKKVFKCNNGQMPIFFMCFQSCSHALGSVLQHEADIEPLLPVLLVLIFFSKLVVKLQQKILLKKSFCNLSLEKVINLIPTYVILHAILSSDSIVQIHLTCSCLFTGYFLVNNSIFLMNWG